MAISEKLYEIAKKAGYDGAEPRTIAGAIDALADTLAGSDVDSGRTIAEAVGALAPYVGGGGMPTEWKAFPLIAFGVAHFSYGSISISADGVDLLNFGDPSNNSTTLTQIVVNSGLYVYASVKTTSSNVADVKLRLSSPGPDAEELDHDAYSYSVTKSSDNTWVVKIDSAPFFNNSPIFVTPVDSNGNPVTS